MTSQRTLKQGLPAPTVKNSGKREVASTPGNARIRERGDTAGMLCVVAVGVGVGAVGCPNAVHREPEGALFLFFSFFQVK